MKQDNKNPKSVNAFVSSATEIPFWNTHIGEEERNLVAHAMEANNFSMGPVTRQLEAEIAKLIDVPYVICTTSGSVALLMAMIALEVQPGDEVIVPTRTFIATAHAATLLGAKAVLVDCLETDTLVDVDRIAGKINERTKVIVPVHLNGTPCDMAAIKSLAGENIAIVEDAAQGLTSHCRDEYLGTIGDIGCFSFGMVKLFSTGQGGAVVTRRKDLYEKLLAIRNHGVRDLVSHTYLQIGGNFKFNDVHASIGLGQIRRAVEKKKAVNDIYRRYEEGLEGHRSVRILKVPVDDGSIATWTEVLCEERQQLMDFLSGRGIQTRKFVPCCHTAPHLQVTDAFANSDRFNAIGLNLPCGPAMPMEFVDKTIEALKEFDPGG